MSRTDYYTKELATPPFPTVVAGTSYRFNALFALVLASWLVTIAGIWCLDGLLVWGAGLLYVIYDAGLLAFVAWKTRKLRLEGVQAHLAKTSAKVTIGILVAEVFARCAGTPSKRNLRVFQATKASKPAS